MKLLISLFILFSLTACKDWGTEGGNPEMDLSSPAIGGYYLSLTICEKRRSCTGLEDKDCSTKVEDQSQITAELRMSSVYATLGELMAHTQDVEISDVHRKACFKAVKDLSCTSTLAIEAFDPDTYENIHLSLRASSSCGDMFKPKN